MELSTVYFEKPGGEENTARTLELAGQRAGALGIKDIVVATTAGDTAVKALDVLKGFRVIVVTHSAGLKEPNTQELTEENRAIIAAKGGVILTGTHALGGIQRTLTQTVVRGVPLPAVGDIAATTLRMFGQGTKVACEIAAMAADAGLIRVDEEIVSIAGTGRGADTALVMLPSYTHTFFTMKVKEIICKPRL